ncbi:MAG: NAD kinase [Acidimicrobiales bacterium]|nr:MAG: NAD kinase [Acidimicrobiales bacterium]
MAKVVFVLHGGRDGAVELARETSRWLRDCGHTVVLTPADAELLGSPELAMSEEELAREAEVAVSFGGDGCMLRAVDLVASRGVPVIGVNMGRLGYLTEVEPSGVRDALNRFFAGEHLLEERMMLQVAITQGEKTAVTHALNEAVLERTPQGHTVSLSVRIDGCAFTTYVADALIVATPTGSTAYSFSARGPIIAPTHACILLTPVSPHMLFDRSMILEPTSELEIGVAGDRPAALAVDGRVRYELGEGDTVVCTRSPFTARLVTFAPRRFHEILKRKFGLADR